MARYRKIPLTELFVDARYQRELSQRRVRKMAEEFDPARVGVLEVSARGNKGYAVFDGQHRLAVLEAVGMEEAACLVHEGLTPRQEAEYFVSIQTERKQPQAIEAFVARVFAEEPKASAIQAIFDKHGIKVGNPGMMTPGGSQAGHIGAVKAAERVFDAGNLDETLEIITSLWSDERKAYDANLIESMSLFLALYGPKVSESKLLDALAMETPISLIRKATAKRMTTGGAIRDLLVEVLRGMVSGGRGGVVLKRPPVFERQVAVRHLTTIREVFKKESEKNGKIARLTQSEITTLSRLTSADAGSALRTMIAVGQVRQSGKKKLPRLPEAPAYILGTTADNPAAD